jgi:hypothetical protein
MYAIRSDIKDLKFLLERMFDKQEEMAEEL